MNVPFVDLKAQYQSIKNEIDQSIARVIENTSFIGGEFVNDFEAKFSKLYGVKHVIGVGNGTDAIYIALRMLGVGVGDEVITSAVSWISTSETITQAGAKPVFVDIDPETYTIDPNEVDRKITAKTKAIIPVHLYGQSAHVSDLEEICRRHNIFLIEDCAQAHFTEENKRYVGKFGIAGTFSFYPGKNLGAYGDAGCIITQDETLAEKMRMYANHGALKKHEHEIEGINSRLDALQASILSAKSAHILDWTRRRIENAKKYNEFLDGVGEVVLPSVRKNTRHTFHLYVIRTKKRNLLKNHLESNGIQTAIHYPAALPNLRAYQYLGHSRSDFPQASQHQDEILSLPMFPELTEEQIHYVSLKVKEFFEH